MRDADPRDRLGELLAELSPSWIAFAEGRQALHKAFFPRSCDEHLKDEFERLLGHGLQASGLARAGARHGRAREGRILVQIGAPGAGKSASIHRVFTSFSGFSGYVEPASGSALVSIVLPSPCTLKQLGNALLAGLGYVPDRDLRENVVWGLVPKHLAAQGVRFVHLDELQHVFQTRDPTEIQKVRDTLKALLQRADWPVSLVLTGLPSIAAFIEGDRQLARRSRFVRFPSVDPAHDAEMIEAMIRGFCEKADVDPAALLSTPERASDATARLCHAADYAFGVMVELVQDAIEDAVLSQVSDLTMENLATAFAARTGCLDRNNVFLSDDWASIDLRSAFQPERLPQAPTSSSASPGRPRVEREE